LHHILAQVAAEFESLEANLRQSFRILAQGRPRAEVTELEGVSIASLGVQFQMFNAAFLNSRVTGREDLEARLARAQSLFLARREAWSFWICEDWLAWPARRALVAACEKFGLRAAAEMPGMAADSLREAKRAAPRMEIVRASAGDSRVMADFRTIGALCFHVPPAWFREVFDDTMPTREFICRVGYSAGLPVATAATVVSHGVIGVYNVATAPDERGKGYAEAMTRQAIAEAARQSGLTRVILQATTQGERLYRRLGFREVSRLVVFNSIEGPN
jgi:ribosomal protein S18 acetylase RimI-like enzyme